MNVANEDVRQYAKENGVYLWECAEAMGITDPTMTRRLRKELTGIEKADFFNVIDEIAFARRKKNGESALQNQRKIKSGIQGEVIKAQIKAAGVSTLGVAKWLGIPESTFYLHLRHTVSVSDAERVKDAIYELSGHTLLEHALKELEQFKKTFSGLQELSDVISAIDEAQKECKK